MNANFQSKNLFQTINLHLLFNFSTMRSLLILFAFCFTLSLSKLYQVVSLFRHGARYHLNSVYDGNATKSMWGQLSAAGMRQHQTLGNILKRQYIDNLHFLNEQYTRSEVEVYSTDVNRTLESVNSQLYGLYGLGSGPALPYVDRIYHLPPYSNKTDDEEQNLAFPSGYQPIPVYINPTIVMIHCENYNALVDKNINSQVTQYNEMNITYTPFLRKMASLFNISSDSMNFSKISSLYDTLTVDKYLGRQLPKTFVEEDYLNLRHLHEWFNNFKISNNLSKALNTGKINRVLNVFDIRQRIPNEYKLKWTFLSAHDTDISAMLLDLNISSAKCIEETYRKGTTTALNCSPNQQYASNIIFQLHSNDSKEFFVKIRHNGKYVYLCEQKNITCPYVQWKSRAKKIMVNVEQVCGKPSTRQNHQRLESSEY